MREELKAQIFDYLLAALFKTSRNYQSNDLHHLSRMIIEHFAKRGLFVGVHIPECLVVCHHHLSLNR
jgi:hypothetical protein